MLYKGTYYYFEIKGEYLIYDNKVMTASNFVRRIEAEPFSSR